MHNIKIRYAALTALLVILADQVSKWWIVEQIVKPIALPDSVDPSAMPFISWLLNAREQMPFAREEILPFFNIVMVWNKGISFGLFNNHKSGPIILTVMALVIVSMFSIWMVRATSGLVRGGIALIIGGAIGNVIDRVRFGAVADFLDFHVAGAHWPAFNIADSTICIGIAMLLIHGLFFDTKIKQAEISS